MPSESTLSTLCHKDQKKIWVLPCWRGRNQGMSLIMVKPRAIFTSIVGFVDHANVVSNQSQVSDSHSLINEASRVGSNEYTASHIGWKICREGLMSDPVTFIVVDSTIPDDSASTLHYSIEDLLFVSNSCWNGAVRNVMHAHNLHILGIFKKMRGQIKHAWSFHDREIYLVDTESLQYIVCCFLQTVVILKWS